MMKFATACLWLTCGLLAAQAAYWLMGWSVGQLALAAGMSEAAASGGAQLFGILAGIAAFLPFYNAVEE